MAMLGPITCALTVTLATGCARTFEHSAAGREGGQTASAPANPFRGAAAGRESGAARTADASAGNAADHYRAAFALLPPDDANADDPDVVLLADPASPAPGDPAAAALVRKHDATNRLLRRGAALGRCEWDADGTEGPGAVLHYITPARKLANLVWLRVRYHFARGAYGEGLSQAADLLALSRHLAQEPFLAAFAVSGGLAPLFGPSPDLARLRTALSAVPTHVALLRAAIAVCLEGEQALEKYPDPSGDGAPFECRRWDGGFELKSKLVFHGAPLTLVVGAAEGGDGL